MPALRARVFPEQMPERETPEWNDLRQKYREAVIDAAAPWRQAQVKEMRELLEKALSCLVSG